MIGRQVEAAAGFVYNVIVASPARGSVAWAAHRRPADRAPHFPTTLGMWEFLVIERTYGAR